MNLRKCGGFFSVGLGLLVYVAGFLVYYPRAVTVVDEHDYIARAVAFAQGRRAVEEVNPLNGAREVKAMPYAPGTSLLMAGPVAAFGWRGAYLVPLLAVVSGVLATAAWCRRKGISPRWALLVLGYPPTLVMGRVGMSDTVSMATVAVGCWLFWEGLKGDRQWWFGAGLVAALSALIREPNVLLLAPLLAGAALRRERRWVNLLVGGLVGTVLWGLGNLVVFGHLLNRAGEVAGAMAWANMGARVGLALMALLVMVPGGLAGAMLYRGERNRELQLGVGAFVVFYLCWWYGGDQSGFLKGLVLGGRFYLPVVPVLALMEGQVIEAWFRRWSADSARARVARWAGCLATAGVVALAAAVHPYMSRFGSVQARIAQALTALAGPRTILVSNTLATRKYFLGVDARLVDYADAPPEALAGALARGEQVKLAFLARTDSAFWRDQAVENDNYVNRLGDRFTVTSPAVQTFSTTDALKVYTVSVKAPP